MAVVGGGPAGAAAGLELARAGARVALLERSRYEAPRLGEVVPPSGRPLLEALGVWRDFERDGHLPAAGNLSLWGAPEPRERSFLFDPYGAGWHVDRQRLDRMLAERARDAGVLLRMGARLTAAERRPRGWRLRLAEASGAVEVEADFVIEASGRTAAFARLRGAARRTVDRLVAVAGFLSPASDAPAVAPFTLVEAVEAGWWYSAPLAGGTLVCAYMSDADLVAAAGLAHLSRWLQQRARASHTERRAAGHQPSGTLRVAPASSSWLEPLGEPGWIAVGDAAMTFDPLSSRGILKGLESGQRGARAALEALGGRTQALPEYCEHLAGQLVAYLRERFLYYGAERRWRDRPFWRRRAEVATARAGSR